MEPIHAACPECGSEKTRTIETRVCSNGARRRRHRCHHCGHRWTLWQGDRPPRQVPVNPNKRLTTEQVLYAVAHTDINNSQLARMFGCSAEAIRRVRNGMLHPELTGITPPDQRLRCTDCQHWGYGECGFGFPDPNIEGLSFATECSMYTALEASPR